MRFVLLGVSVMAVGGVILFDSMVTSMIFFPDRNIYYQPADVHLDAEVVELFPAPGVVLHNWFIPPEKDNPVLLYIHGNAGNISGRLHIAAGWATRGFGIFMLDYRGFGKSTGEIRHEDDLTQDALAAYRWMVESKKLSPDSIVLYGESIGCAPAVRLATQQPCRAVVLMAPFTRLIDMARLHYGSFIPESLLKQYRFDNLSAVASVRTPLFIMHGTEDEIVPFSMGERLFQAALDPKEFFRVPGGHHNDLSETAGKDFWDIPAHFLRHI